MAETPDNTIPTPDAGGVVASATDAKPSSYVGTDGTLQPGWKEAWVPDEFKTSKVWDTLKDVPSAMKQIGNLEKLIGKQGKGIMRPGDKATPEEWGAYYEAIGRPKSADDYSWHPSEELKDHYRPDSITNFKNTFHKLGLTNEQATGVFSAYQDWLKSEVTAQETAKARAAFETEIALKQKWGDDYEGNLHLANRMINDFADKDEAPVLLASFGNSPVLAKFLANIAEKFIESSAIIPDAQQSATLDEQITRLQDTPGYMNGQLKASNPTEHERILRELKKLYAQRYPEKAVA